MWNKVWEESFKAGADLRTKQGYIVDQTAENTIGVCDGAADRGIGVLTNKPNTNEAGQVVIMGRAEVVSDGSGTAIAVGDFIGPNSSGKAVKKETADYRTIGIACQASSADGTVIEALLFGPGAFRTAGG